MTQHTNSLGQPIGYPIEDWQGCQVPPKTKMQGKYCRLEAMDIEKHAEDLFEAYGNDRDHSNWTYLPYGPFDGFDDFHLWLKNTTLKNDPLFHTVIDLGTEKAVGVATYLRIRPTFGAIEVGHIHFSPLIQRTPVSTEAMYLMMKRVFDELGYRRYEWKCDSLNSPSCNAAQRLGFKPEGIFRQLIMYKNRNRDTAWFSIIDSEWPALKAMFKKWLAPENFNEGGEQIHSLQHYFTSTDKSI